MYDKKTINKIVSKLELIKNKLLLSNGNELIVITDWVIQSKETTKGNLFGKKTTQTVYYIESITFDSKDAPIKSSTTMVWWGGSEYCTHKGVNNFLNWRKKWLDLREQFKSVGYKVSKIQK